jgi:hypothetical protein
MIPSRYWKPVLCAALLAAAMPAAAQTQSDDKDKWMDMKAFIPPIIALPPAAQVAPGRIEEPRTYSDPMNFSNPQTPPSASGLRITVPMR